MRVFSVVRAVVDGRGEMYVRHCIPSATASNACGGNAAADGWRTNSTERRAFNEARNLRDGCAYALAQTLAVPLLFKHDDCAKADVPRVK